MRLSGGSLRNENIVSGQELFNFVFEDDASYSTSVYMWEMNVLSYENKTPIKIRLYKRTFSNANGLTVKFQTPINTPIIVGDVVYDSKLDEYGICTESFNVDDIHWQGKITICNWTLKWQDKDNGNIYEYPCHDINSTQYNSGETGGATLTIGSSQHMITLPCDKNTVKLNTPYRFFLDKNTIKPTAFVVSQCDTTSYAIGKKGLVKVTVMENVVDYEKDNLELGICDYINPLEFKSNGDKNEPKASKSVITYKTNIIKSGGDAQMFTGKFYDNSGNEIKNMSPKWDIICDFKNELIISSTENQISIGIDNDEFVDEEFKLVLTNEEDKYSSVLIIRIESLL